MIYPNEPQNYWHDDEFNNFLKWAVENKVSDICLLPSSTFWVRKDGEWLRCSERYVTSDEIFTILDFISGNPAASATLMGGLDIDFAYELKIDRFKNIRFRGNASACQDGWSIGAEVVLRVIPDIPPPLETLNVENDILEHGFPNNGLVLVTGTVGTGKSTLLSSMLRRVRETMTKKVITYESPIEFNLMDIENPLGPLVQTSIPEHLENFTSAPRNAVRRAADVILVGESRDPETLKSMLEVSETGICAYSTVHTRSVHETVTRIINAFNSGEQNEIAITLVSSLRLIVQQRLIPSLKGGRVAIREFLPFTDKHRKLLSSTDKNNYIPTIRKFVREDGQSLYFDACKKFDEGLISDVDLDKIKVEDSGD